MDGVRLFLQSSALLPFQSLKAAKCLELSHAVSPSVSRAAVFQGPGDYVRLI